MTRSLVARFAVLAVAATVTLTGCTVTPDREDRPTIVPATPAVAPEPGTAPAGTVVPAGAGDGLAFDPVARRLAAIVDNAVVLYSVDGGLTELVRLEIGRRPNQVVPRGDKGGFLVAAPDSVTAIDAKGVAVTTRVNGDVRTVVPYTADGVDALAGTAHGEILPIGTATHTVGAAITGPVEASTLLAADGQVVVADRLQASLTEVDVAGRTIGKGLRVGRGITNAAADPAGRIFAVDTGKNQVIGYTAQPFMERFLFPVSGAPWAVTYDTTDKLMWISRTATNEVVGYALGSGTPEQRKLFPTVRQPNAIAVDDKTGTLYVQSATGGGIQAIATR